MNKYKNTPRDIHSRIYKFVVNCFKNVVKKISKTNESFPIISQISSSLTSIGANDQEADGASTKKDFIAKYYIVKKETKETEYWLLIIKDTGLLSSETVKPYIEECHEILMIVSKIINNTKY
ncbi:MAG: four helix bundle protein [Patescibacteria group bacterium]|jgi:four helix bundle protein